MIKILQFLYSAKANRDCSLLPAISNYALGKYLSKVSAFLLLLVVLCLCLPHLVISALFCHQLLVAADFADAALFKTAMVLQKRQLLIRWEI